MREKKIKAEGEEKQRENRDFNPKYQGNASNLLLKLIMRL